MENYEIQYLLGKLRTYKFLTKPPLSILDTGKENGIENQVTGKENSIQNPLLVKKTAFKIRYR